MDKSWITLGRWDQAYHDGVRSFLDFVMANCGDTTLHYCPCKKCKCATPRHRFSIETVEQHLARYGFWVLYTNWIYHGEPEFAGPHDHGQFAERGSSSNDPTTNWINDMFPRESGVFDEAPDVQLPPPEMECFPDIEPLEPLPRSPVNTSGMEKYNNLIALQQTPLYPGCSKTVLESVMGVMKIKTENKGTVKSVDDWLKIWGGAMPPGHRLPTSHHKVRHILKDLGLSYIKIHACRYDCVLFYGEGLADLEYCPVCNTERYKFTPKGNKKAVKILRYFPLIDRLERLFMCAFTAEAMRWWAERNVPDDDTLRHPADGEAWKKNVLEFPEFASEVRNVWLGLSSDGFNPFGKKELQYSVWPVILIPYNFPPWMCMKKEYNMLTLLIPGPGYPGKCLDVYLRPVIEELRYLSLNGHLVYDRFKNEMFRMHAMLVGTISDFPGRGMLSGSVTRGYRACSECMTVDCSSPHCSKIVQMRHRRWLPHDHPFRDDAQAFDGTEERGWAPEQWTGEEILAVLNEYDFGPLSNHPDVLRTIPERPDRYRFWSHKSILWELPYWARLATRYYLDVMHIEKNVGEAVVGTVLNWEKKTKDTPKARVDLRNMGLRDHLWLREGRSKMPQAPYTVTRDQKHEIFGWLSNVRYPYGYAGNISKCVNYRDNKMYGLKSHDCHVLLQRLFPIFIRAYLEDEVVEPLVALSRFFQKLCAREVRKSDLMRMHEEIVFILCKFERIFPPNFFDIMPHLMIHLPQQLLLTGPVHYTWMYPIERQLGDYKKYVHNKSAPEGCIAEAYIAHECVTYAKLYLGAMEDPPQHPSRDDPEFNLSIVANSVVPYGSFKKKGVDKLPDHEVGIAHWWVLINCPEVQYWKRHHLHCKEVRGDVEYHNTTFADYFPQWLMQVAARGGHTNYSEELRLLSMKPISSTVRPMCDVNGVKYICEARDGERKTQNCGVMVDGAEGGVDFYGVLQSVVELIYGNRMKVHLFKCRWFDTRPHRIRIDQYGILSVNTATSVYEDDPFVFATAAKKVFYLDDPLNKGTWKVVNHVSQRDIYSATTLGVSTECQEATAYQEPDAGDIPESSTIRDNNVTPGRVVRLPRGQVPMYDVNPNRLYQADDDSDDEYEHRLPDINYYTTSDSSDEDDSDYHP